MPMYTKIADDILKKIQTGEWVPGQMIPSESKLCSQYQVSRPTVRAAVGLLVSQGRLVRKKGKGSFVTKPKTLEDATVFMESFTQAMAEKGVKIVTEVLEHRVLPADPCVSEKLKIEPGEDVFKLVRLRYVENSFEEGPIVFNVTYIPGRFSFLQKCDFEAESLTSALERNGVQRRHLEKNIHAVCLEGRIARILGVPNQSLGICIRTVGYSEERKEVIEYTDSYYPSDRNEFVLKINV